MNVKRTQAERSEATRDALIEAARSLFAERGYAAVGTEEIVRVAGVTRGALYHHFDGKCDLFEAVYERIEVELAQRIARGALDAGAAAPLEAMRAGAEMFLRAATEPEAQRIVLLDGPSVLGWDRWREIAAEHGLGLIEATLRAAIDAGAIAEQPVRPACPRADGRPRRGGDARRPRRGPRADAGRSRPHARRGASRAQRGVAGPRSAEA